MKEILTYLREKKRKKDRNLITNIFGHIIYFGTSVIDGHSFQME